MLISTGHLLYAWCSVSSFCFLNQLYQGERDSERLGDVPDIAQLLRGRAQVRLGSVTQKPAGTRETCLPPELGAALGGVLMALGAAAPPLT